MSKKADLKRIERLEAFAHSKMIEDARRRHAESIAQMSDEELASLDFVVDHIAEVRKEDPSKADELFKSGLAATEQLDERGRLGWRRFCETGGQAALQDVFDAHEDEEGYSARTSDLQRDIRALFEGVNPGGRRTKGVNFHRARLRKEPEREALSEKDTPSRPRGR